MERGNGGSGRPPSPPPPAAPAERKAAWRDGAVTYFHLLFYIAISGGQIFFNKASQQGKPRRTSPTSRSPARFPPGLLPPPLRSSPAGLNPNEGSIQCAPVRGISGGSLGGLRLCWPCLEWARRDLAPASSFLTILDATPEPFLVYEVSDFWAGFDDRSLVASSRLPLWFVYHSASYCFSASILPQGHIKCQNSCSSALWGCQL